MHQFKTWIKIRYPEFLFEQFARPSLKPINANDIKLLTSGGLPFQPNEILTQIVNITPYQLMASTRKDPSKFQSDVSKMLPAQAGGENEMIMNKQNMIKPHRVLIVTDAGVQRITRENNIEGFIANLPNNERLLVVPQSGYDKLPDASNIIGVMNEKGKRSIAHEAGHLAQQKPSKFGNQVQTQEEYLSLPDEVGTRLGFLKNINSKATLRNLGAKGFNAKIIPYIESMIDALPEDEMQRFEVIIDLTKFFDTVVKNNSEIMNMLKTKELFDNFSKNVYMQFVKNIFNSDQNITDLVELIAGFKRKDPAKYQSLLKNIKYAYPRVALGGQQQYGDKSQQGQMA